MKTVSVIIPVYNSAPYLEACLISVARQTYGALEIILVDDCSTDASPRICEAFREEHPERRILFVQSERNVGQSAARNKGIALATGEYIMFVDSDDTISKESVEKLVRAAEEGGAEVAIGENWIINAQEEKKTYVPVGFKENVLDGNENILAHYLRGNWYNPVWNKLVRVELFRCGDDALHFKEGYIFEDELWSFVLATRTSRLAVVREPCYNYVVRPQSTMATNVGVKRWTGMLRIIPFMRQYIERNGLTNHMGIQRFFLLKLVQTANALDTLGELGRETFDVVCALNYTRPWRLRREHQLSLKEAVAYSYLVLPRSLAWCYYKLTRCYFRFLRGRK